MTIVMKTLGNYNLPKITLNKENSNRSISIEEMGKITEGPPKV